MRKRKQAGRGYGSDLGSGMRAPSRNASEMMNEANVYEVEAGRFGRSSIIWYEHELASEFLGRVSGPFRAVLAYGVAFKRTPQLRWWFIPIRKSPPFGGPDFVAIPTPSLQSSTQHCWPR